MRHWKFLSLGAACALAACGSNEEAAGGQVSVEDAATMMADAVTPRAGQYQASGKLLDFQMPGMPDGQLDMMKTMFEGALASGHTYCLTEAEAQAGARQMAQGLADSDECSFANFNVSGGKMDADMVCKMEDGIQANMKLAGTFDDESSSMTMDIDQVIPGAPGEGRVVMKMQMDSKRTGDCG